MSVSQIVVPNPVSPELQAPLRTLAAALALYVEHTKPEEDARYARAQRLATPGYIHSPRGWANAG